VIAVSDGVALAAQCDGVILVVRVGTVSHEVLRRVADQIERSGKISAFCEQRGSQPRRLLLRLLPHYQAYNGGDQKT